MSLRDAARSHQRERDSTGRQAGEKRLRSRSDYLETV